MGRSRRWHACEGPSTSSRRGRAFLPAKREAKRRTRIHFLLALAVEPAGAIDLLDGVLLGLAQTRGCWGRTRVELFLPCCSPGWWDLATPPVCPFNCNRLVGCKARSLQRNHALAQDRDPGAANEVSTPLAETAQPAARKLCSARAAAQLS